MKVTFQHTWDDGWVEIETVLFTPFVVYNMIPGPKADEPVEPVIPDEFVEEARLPASMENWYPRIKELVPTPKTAWAKLEPAKIHEGTINEMYFADWDVEGVRESIDAVGGPPVFVRTDMASDKHHFESASIIRNTDEESINSTIGAVISGNLSHGVIGVPFSSLVIREKLDLWYEIRAWENLPVAAEVRVRVDEGDVRDWMFYWEEEAVERGIQLYDDSEDNWRELLQETKARAEKEADGAIEMAEKIAGEFPGFWSVDFALTADGEWYCIDMAPGNMSHFNEEKSHQM